MIFKMVIAALCLIAYVLAARQFALAATIVILAAVVIDYFYWEKVEETQHEELRSKTAKRLNKA